MTRAILHSVFLLVVATVSACATVVSERRAPDGARVWDVVAAVEIDPNDGIDRLRSLRAVHLGERHDDALDHRVQAAIVHGLLDRGVSLVVGFEMVEAAQQAVLDRFCRGELDVGGLEQELDWRRTWGYDFAMYAPLFGACRRGARLVALSPPLAQVRKLSRGGSVALEPAERASYTALDTRDPAHRAFFEAALGGHPMPPGLTLESMFEAQIFRDEFMAERMAAALATEPTRLAVVIAGRGHTERAFGVPSKLAALGIAPFAIVHTGTIAEASGFARAEYPERPCDYVWQP
jgi:uncharacterized iron-regulated protein